MRLAPSTLTIPHNQRARVTVHVEDTAGQPVDDVPVTFTPSEGSMAADTPYTRGGEARAAFTAATGSDSPRTAFVVVVVEDINVTVFIDIVPAVYGR
ncbi:hypothetical protein NKDENANG_02872 [Candidatus Entotheonellaceae bacterium PAL068K]